MSEIQRQPNLPYYYQAVRSEIAPLLPARIANLLEVGCASGATMCWLRTQRQIDYSAGVELNPRVAEVARAYFDDVEISRIESAGFPFRVDRFDLILALDVLEHLADPWGTVARLRNKLTDDGTLIASIPNVACYRVSMPLLLRGRWRYDDEGLLDRTHLRFFDRNGAIELFNQNQFRIDRIETVKAAADFLRWLTHNSEWYSYKLLSKLLPTYLFEFQFLIAAKALPL